MYGLKARTYLSSSKSFVGLVCIYGFGGCGGGFFRSGFTATFFGGGFGGFADGFGGGRKHFRLPGWLRDAVHAVSTFGNADQKILGIETLALGGANAGIVARCQLYA